MKIKLLINILYCFIVTDSPIQNIEKCDETEVCF